MGRGNRGTCWYGNGIDTFPWRGSGVLEVVRDAFRRARDVTCDMEPRDYPESRTKPRDFLFVTNDVLFIRSLHTPHKKRDPFSIVVGFLGAVAVPKKTGNVKLAIVFFYLLVRDVLVRERDVLICAGRACAGKGFHLYHATMGLSRIPRLNSRRVP